MSASECICSPAPAPFDHAVQVNPKCLAHRQDIQLVAAGWTRNGAYWTHDYYRGMWTIEQAFYKMVENKEKEKVL